MSSTSKTTPGGAGQLASLFAPSSVAVVGATNDTAKMGGLYFEALLASFKGTSYPVSRGGAPVQGVASYKQLSDLPEVPDLVFVAVPAAAAITVTKEAADLGVPVVVLHTAGFAELGDEGARDEQEITRYARDRGTRIVGPNSMGSYGGETGANLLGLPVRPGGIAFISASGTLIEMLAPRLNACGLGLRNVVGFENQADVQIHEYVQYCATDPGVDVIAIYMEGIKDEHGRRFVDALAEASAAKPVVVLRGAKTSAGQRSAVSHTAAIVSPTMIYEGLLRQAGVIEIDDLSLLAPLLEALSLAPRARNKSVAVLGNGGGLATIMADAVESAGLQLPTFSESVQSSLRDALNPLAAVGNPVDAVIDHDGDGTIWADLARLILRDDIGAILKFGLYRDESGTRSIGSIRTEARALGQIRREFDVPVLVYSPHGDADEDVVRLFMDERVPVLRSPAAAGRVLNALARTATASESNRKGTSPTAAGPPFLSEFEGLAVAERLGLPVPGRCYLSADALREAPAPADLPDSDRVVLKIAATGIHHKSELGGVQVGCPREDAWDRARRMLDDFDRSGEVTVDGVIVMEQVASSGPELLISATRDPAIGPVVTIGAGGVLTEVLRDVVTFAAPLSEVEASTMLESLSVAPLLHGYRGSEGTDIRLLAATIAAFSRAFAEDRDIQEVEINPLMTGRDRVWAVDAIVRRKERTAC